MKCRGGSRKEWDPALMYKGNTPGGCAWSQEGGSGATCFMLICLDVFRWAPSHGQTWSNITSIIPTINYTYPDGYKEVKRSCHEAKDGNWHGQLDGLNASFFSHCT